MGTIALRSDVREQLGRIGNADIVIGIPSFNNVQTIAHVVRAVQAGLAKYFPENRAMIVDSDGGSTDGTMEAARDAAIADFDAILLRHRTAQAPKIVFPYSGIPGKGSAFRSIFEIATELQAKACAVIDSDLRSITPEWVELLIKPVLSEGFDYVSPLYHRHKFDGTITNSIVYPLTRALYGKRIRQPIGGDFGFSGKMAAFYMTQDVWETDVARFGIDIWMTTTAIANGFKIAQSFLGAKIHDPKDPGADLSSMLYQVLSSTFSLMETYSPQWLPIRGSQAVPSFGFEYTVGLEPITIDTQRMLTLFREGILNLGEIWLDVLGRGDFGEIEKLGSLPDHDLRFPPGLWTRIVFDYALAFHKRTLPVEHLIKSMTPLYIGKTASFILAARNMGQEEAEAEIEKLCLEFENGKDYLAAHWN